MIGKEKLIELLPSQESNAVHLDTLADALHISQSEVKAAVKAARMDGVWICSSHKGYWLADDRQEVQRLIDLMEKQAFSRLQSIKQLKLAMKIPEGQKSLFNCAEETGNGLRYESF